jgi:hypothetical protein
MKHVSILFIVLLLQVSCKTGKPIVINIPESFEKPYLIQDCPEELIIDGMPFAGKSDIPREYYIYKEVRREIKEFDSVWVSIHCNVKVTHVY